MEEEKIQGFSDYLAIFKRRKRHFFVPAFLILIIIISLAIGLPSIYRSEATILIEQQEIPADLVRSTVTSFAGERIQMISQRVLSSDNLSRIIDEFELYQAERSKVSQNSLVKKLRNQIELEMISADMIDPRSGRPTEAIIAFKLSFSNENPQIAQNVTEEFVSLFLNENEKQRTQSALETSGFLASEAKKLSEEVAELENQLAAFKEKNINNLPEHQQMNQQLMERKESELAEKNQQIRTLEERRIYLRLELAQMSPTSDLFTSDGKRVLGVEDKLMLLQTEYVGLKARYTDKYPPLIKLKEEIDALKKAASGAGNAQTENSNYTAVKADSPAYKQLQTELNATEVELASLKQAKEEIINKIKDYELRLMQSPQIEKEYRNLTRDYDTALTKYNEVKDKQLEAELSESLEREHKGERFSLLEPPLLPESPAKPNRLAIIFLGFIFSFAGGIGSVVVRESTDQAVYGSKGIMEILHVPPVVVIPYIENIEDRQQKSTRQKLLILGVIIAILVGVAILHFLFIPLDTLFNLIVEKFGHESGL